MRRASSSCTVRRCWASRRWIAVKALRKAGYLTVTEFDDHPEHFRMMQMGGDLSFRGVHAVQTSTAAMAEILRKYNPEIAVFPNAVVSLPDVRNFARPDRLTLFFGALNREKDWQSLMPVINAVAATGGRAAAVPGGA